MLTASELKGKWSQIKGQVRERWGEITENDFTKVQRNVDQLVGLIEEKTGTTRGEIEEFLHATLQNAESVVQNATDTVRDYAARATDVVRDQYDRVGKQVEIGLEDAQEAVRARPAVSVGVAFGAGLLAGALLSVVLRSDRR